VRVVAVANKVMEPADIEHVARRTGLEVIGAVPLDPVFAAAERAGKAPLDAAPESAGVQAVSSLVDRLVKEYDHMRVTP
jgi:CO dehydrogenase nickel-insertion accessory protein CooC1